MGENVWWFLADHCGLDKVWLWDHSITTLPKRWVGGCGQKMAIFADLQ